MKLINVCAEDQSRSREEPEGSFVSDQERRVYIYFKKIF